MKYITDLLTRWALATGKVAGTDVRGATMLDLPALLMPVAIARFPTRLISSGSSSRQADSFIVSQAFDIPQNQAANQYEIVSMAKGAWEFIVNFAHLDSWSAIFGPTPAFQVMLVDPTTTQFAVLNSVPVANVRGALSWAGNLTMEADGWRWRVLTPATVAAQTSWFFISVVANRLS